MIANEGMEVDFSLIIPTRSRPELLRRCLLSFFSKAKRKPNNEAILLADHDDTSVRDISDFILSNHINAKVITVWRSDLMIRDYNNFGAQCTLGKYIWMLNDDFEMVTDNWDEKLKNVIEDFTQSNGDRCAYVMVDDSTHGPSGWNVLGARGCCCPIMTRETVEAMNGIMPWQINSWGADIALFHIFRKLAKYRILDFSSQIRVLHHSRHNNSAAPDEVNRRVERISGRQGVNGDEEMSYINRLNSLLR